MIKLFCGAMYSGKSESLVRDMIKFTYAKKKILFIRPYIDDRGYITHSNSDSKYKECSHIVSNLCSSFLFPYQS